MSKLLYCVILLLSLAAFSVATALAFRDNASAEKLFHLCLIGLALLVLAIFGRECGRGFLLTDRAWRKLVKWGIYTVVTQVKVGNVVVAIIKAQNGTYLGVELEENQPLPSCFQYQGRDMYAPFNTQVEGGKSSDPLPGKSRNAA